MSVFFFGLKESLFSDSPLEVDSSLSKVGILFMGWFLVLDENMQNTVWNQSSLYNGQVSVFPGLCIQIFLFATHQSFQFIKFSSVYFLLVVVGVIL